jgi:ABC-type nickel/cobalt efflux system permease component RcnA
MRIVLFLGVALAALVGLGHLLIGSGPTAQLSGWVLLLIASVLFVGAGIIGAVDRLRRAMTGQPEETQSDRHRYPPV